jgi:hypothetical protein
MARKTEVIITRVEKIFLSYYVCAIAAAAGEG